MDFGVYGDPEAILLTLRQSHLFFGLLLCLSFHKCFTLAVSVVMMHPWHAVQFLYCKLQPLRVPDRSRVLEFSPHLHHSLENEDGILTTLKLAF